MTSEIHRFDKVIRRKRVRNLQREMSRLKERVNWPCKKIGGVSMQHALIVLRQMALRCPIIPRTMDSGLLQKELQSIRSQMEILPTDRLPFSFCCLRITEASYLKPPSSKIYHCHYPGLCRDFIGLGDKI